MSIMSLGSMHESAVTAHMGLLQMTGSGARMQHPVKTGVSC